ncbi:hypothetical protein, partial [Mesorhizobium sp. J18]|uniref:hypothetical protein n=1 Tax=Mesorhizobium sp. J18 TaxID=935263 RepID=UPI001AEF2BD7
ETISSGFGRLLAILDPPFPNHNGGPLHWGRIIAMQPRIAGQADQGCGRLSGSHAAVATYNSR